MGADLFDAVAQETRIHTIERDIMGVAETVIPDVTLGGTAVIVPGPGRRVRNAAARSADGRDEEQAGHIASSTSTLEAGVRGSLDPHATIAAMLGARITGLDPEQRASLRSLLSEQARERAVLLATHQTEDVSTLCDRVIVLDDGCVRFDGTVAALVGTAAGRVFFGPEPTRGALVTWRTGTGAVRSVGGVPYAGEADKLIDQLRLCVEASLDRAAKEEIREIDLLQEILHDDLAAFVYDKIRRRPMVLPVVVEV